MVQGFTVFCCIPHDRTMRFRAGGLGLAMSTKHEKHILLTHDTDYMTVEGPRPNK